MSKVPLLTKDLWVFSVYLAVTALRVEPPADETAEPPLKKWLAPDISFYRDSYF